MRAKTTRSIYCAMACFAVIGCATSGLIETQAAAGDSVRNDAVFPVAIRGEGIVWHRLEMTFDGPSVDERADSFRNFRFDMVFTHSASGKSYTVPGYFAADGNAAQSSAASGNKWRVLFAPDQPGPWTWRATFRRGTDVAVSLQPAAGESAGYFDGASGRFTIGAAELETDSPSFIRHGRIVHKDSHYPVHAGSDKIFLKTGAGSPENIFAYSGIDGTRDFGGTRYPALGDNQLHDFQPHVADWKAGDPDWQDGKARGIVGAVNYLAGVGVNAQYFVAMNVEGDGQDVWPWTGPEDRYQFDVSKLDQWQIVMDHMDDKGIVKDFLFTETENESLLEQKEGEAFFAVSRKLYYREMIARFGHNLGLTWNLGEEMGVVGNTGEDPWRAATTPAQRLAFVRYIAALDPYNHPIVMHNWPDGEEDLYGPLLGEATYSGISLQAHEDYEKRIVEWRARSAAAGRKWMIAIDEPLGWEFGARPDSADPDHDRERTTVLWPALLSGSAGIDWYFGWQNNAPTSDLSNEDMRSRHNLWQQSRIARELLTEHLSLQDMIPSPELGREAISHVLAQPDEVYAAYLSSGGSGDLDLSHASGPFSVR